MNSRLRNLLILSSVLLVSGCATKPWKAPVDSLHADSYHAVIRKIQQGQAAGPDCIAADVAIVVENRIGRRAVSGYLQLRQPDAIKFVVSNPFGQPLFALAGSDQAFRLVDTRQRLILTGNLDQFCMTLDIPKELATDRWPIWLTGRFPGMNAAPEIRTDSEQRGVWVVFAGSGAPWQEHLLLDPASWTLRSRMITNKNEVVLRLDYYYPEGDQDSATLSQPERIVISNLDFGTEATVEFSLVEELAECRAEDFVIPFPPGYVVRPL